MKLNIRKKLVSLAVASVVTGGAMMAIPAQAMNISQNNVGQVLLFPYYTVKGGYDTILSVVNTSAKTALFKIRFREASDSDEVRDFNVILSPHDVWNGAVTMGETGPLFRTYDKSCTSPMLPGMTTTALRAADGAKGEVAFVSNGTAGVTDNTEGYFEIILMGVADPINNTGAAAATLQAGALHDASGVPANCGAVDALFANDVTTTLLDSQMSAPENILKGSLTLINVTHGISFAPEPTAIENFQTQQAIVSAPSDLRPDLTDGSEPADANFLDNGSIYSVGGLDSVDAVSTLLTYGSVADEYISGTNAGSNWIVTLPTKHHYSKSACYEINMSLYNREEKTTIILDSTNFSPYNPTTNTVDLCAESTVITFNGMNMFGAGTNRLNVDTTSVGLQGWVDLHFAEGINNGTSVVGLPVIGFAALGRDSGDATVNYGTTESFSGQRTYAPLP
jgi:hypothetical protein